MERSRRGKVDIRSQENESPTILAKNKCQTFPFFSFLKGNATDFKSVYRVSIGKNAHYNFPETKMSTLDRLLWQTNNPKLKCLS